MTKNVVIGQMVSISSRFGLLGPGSSVVGAAELPVSSSDLARIETNIAPTNTN